MRLYVADAESYCEVQSLFCDHISGPEKFPGPSLPWVPAGRLEAYHQLSCANLGTMFRLLESSPTNSSSYLTAGPAGSPHLPSLKWLGTRTAPGAPAWHTVPWLAGDGQPGVSPPQGS